MMPGYIREPITPEIYEEKVADGTFFSVLDSHDSKPGEVFFLPAGRVHAIGAGNLLAEIQESSGITYRIFDYNRKDASGNTRELHTELAKDAIDYTVYPDYKSKIPADDVTDADIVSCQHFKVRRIIVSDTSDLEFDNDSFTLIICVSGTVRVKFQSGELILSAGHTIQLSAALDHITEDGYATIIAAKA